MERETLCDDAEFYLRLTSEVLLVSGFLSIIWMKYEFLQRREHGKTVTGSVWSCGVYGAQLQGVVLT